MLRRECSDQSPIHNVTCYLIPIIQKGLTIPRRDLLSTVMKLLVIKRTLLQDVRLRMEIVQRNAISPKPEKLPFGYPF